MDLKTFLEPLTRAEKEALADRAGTKVIYLQQIAGGHAQPSGAMAKRIEAATRGAVTRIELRSDLFGDIEEPAPYTGPLRRETDHKPETRGKQRHA